MEGDSRKVYEVTKRKTLFFNAEFGNILYNTYLVINTFAVIVHYSFLVTKLTYWQSDIYYF